MATALTTATTTIKATGSQQQQQEQQQNQQLLHLNPTTSSVRISLAGEVNTIVAV